MILWLQRGHWIPGSDEEVGFSSLHRTAGQSISEFMTNNADNRRRAFAEVVSIDAWHDPFGPQALKVDLHADVVFGTARIGGEPDAPVRFRLSIRQAQVVVVIPETEPVSVDRSSVSRDEPRVKGKITEIVERKAHADIKGSAGASLSPTKFTVKAAVDTNAEAEITATKKIEVLSELELITVTLRKTAEGHYGWTIKSTNGGALDGRPWDAQLHPRLKLVDLRRDKSKGIPPSVRVEVRCRREDLIIEDLIVKDENKWNAAQARLGFRNRMVAAEAYIRKKLIDEGLDVQNIEDIFGEVTLGSVTTADRQL